MCIERISNGTVKISLDKNDLERLGISYETIDSSSEKTKEALLSILKQAREETGISSACSRIFVEIFPMDSGLTIYFTIMQDNSAPKSSDSEFMSPYEFSFSSLDSLINGCVCLFSQCSHRIFQSSLYRIENIYHLLIYPLDPKDDSAVKLLKEFGYFNGRGERYAAYLNEHAVPMLPKDAVDKMAMLA